MEDLPLILTNDIVEIMIAMEVAQTVEWYELLDKMSSDQGRQYVKLKGLHQKKEMSVNILSNHTEWEKDELEYWHRYVNHNRSSWDLTLEDEFIMMQNTNSYTEEELIKSHISSKDKILYRQQFINNEEKFTFFFVTNSPFSQWHNALFIGGTFIYGDEKINEIAVKDCFPVGKQYYTSTEQFMMYHKAMLFFDRKIATEIMSITDVKEIKKLGRQVKGFDEAIWEYFRSKVVYEGNKAKFMQNEDLRKALFATKGTTLVEASPNDTIWGIGLAEDDERALKRKTWQGKNLLGEILTQIRIELMGEY